MLIVEDDPSLLKLYQLVFTMENYKTEIATDGREGLTKVKATNPEVVLLDIMMPKMNGFEFLDEIKKDTICSKIPVIVLSNLASEEDKEKALKKGAIKYLVKSDYLPKEVVSEVETTISTVNIR